MAAQDRVDALAGRLAGAGEVVRRLGELARAPACSEGTRTGDSSPASASPAGRSASRRSFFLEREPAEPGSLEGATGSTGTPPDVSILAGAKPARPLP